MIAAAALLYTPKRPSESEPVPGLRLRGRNGLELAPGAPQWKMLRLAPALGAHDRWTDPIPARVRFDETSTAHVDSPLTGRVAQVLVELGDRVHRGAPLFVVDSPEIASLRSDHARAAVDFDAARVQYERVLSLVRVRAVPAKDEAEARQRLDDARLNLRAAQEKLTALKVRGGGNQFTALAPRDGVIVEKQVLVGQDVTAEAQHALILIADLSDVWVVADLPEAEVGDLRPGGKARVGFPALPSVALQGTVESVPPVVDPQRHTVPIRVRVDNRDGSLRINMFAEVRLALPPLPQAVEVPATALVSDGVSQYVFVQGQPGHFSKREVTTGLSHEGVVEVQRGLRSGEIVVTRGALLLDNQLAVTEP